MKKLILSLTLALLSSGLFAQQVIQKSGMRILNLKRSTNNGNANTFEFRISSNINGADVIAQRSLSIAATQNAADIALLANPSQKNPQFLLKSNGNVGIGTNNPDYRLSVTGTNASVFSIGRTGSNSNNNTFNFRISNSSDGTFNTAQSGSLIIVPTRKSADIALITDISGAAPQFVVKARTGYVGIGTSTPRDMLAVNGTIRARKVRVMTSIGLADYVFAEDYDLKPLTEVAQYVKANHHLPNLPSAQEVKENGLEIAEFQNKLLEKIEELTLYAIDQEKRILAQEQRLQALEKENAQLKTSVNNEDQ